MKTTHSKLRKGGDAPAQIPFEKIPFTENSMMSVAGLALWSIPSQVILGQMSIAKESMVILGLLLITAIYFSFRNVSRVLQENGKTLNISTALVRAMARHQIAVAVILFLLVLAGVLWTIRYTS